MRRATESLSVEYGPAAVNGNGRTRVEGVQLKNFLMDLDEFEQMFHKLERRVREARVVEVLSDASLKIDTKAHFTEKENLERLVEELRKKGVAAQVLPDEEHSAFYAMFHDATNAER